MVRKKQTTNIKKLAAKSGHLALCFHHPVKNSFIFRVKLLLLRKIKHGGLIRRSLCQFTLTELRGRVSMRFLERGASESSGGWSALLRSSLTGCAAPLPVPRSDI